MARPQLTPSSARSSGLQPAHEAAVRHPLLDDRSVLEKARDFLSEREFERFLTTPLIGLFLAIVAAVIFASGWYRETRYHARTVEELNKLRDENKDLRSRLEGGLSTDDHKPPITEASAGRESSADSSLKKNKASSAGPLAKDASRGGAVVKQGKEKSDRKAQASKEKQAEAVKGSSSDRAEVARATPSSSPATPTLATPHSPDTASTLPGTPDEVNRLLNEVNRLLNAGQWVDAKTPLDQATSLDTAAQPSRRLELLTAWYDGHHLTPVPYDKLLELAPVRYGDKPYVAVIAETKTVFELLELEGAPGPKEVPALRNAHTENVGSPPLLLTSLGSDGSFAVSNKHWIKGIDGRGTILDGKGTNLVDMWSDTFRQALPDRSIATWVTKISLGRFAYDRTGSVMLVESLGDTAPGDEDAFSFVWPDEGEQTSSLKPRKKLQLSRPRMVDVAGIAYFPKLGSFVIVHDNGSLTRATYTSKKFFYEKPYFASKVLPPRLAAFRAHAFDTMRGVCALAFGTTVRVYDMHGDMSEKSNFEHGSPVSAVALGEGGDLLATGGTDKTIRLFDLTAKTPKPPLLEYRVPGRVFRLAFGPDDQYLVAGVADEERSGPGPEGVADPGSKIYLWRLTSARQAGKGGNRDAATKSGLSH
jgi:hypothetical protein